jgi:hypothetical protein
MKRTAQVHRVPRRALLQATLGVVLVGASVFGVGALLDQADQTRTVGIVAGDVSAGASVRDMEVDFIEIPSTVTRLESLTQEEWASLSDMVANRTLRAGDVVSASDFSLPDNSDLTGITLDLSIGEPSWLAPGQRVVLWVAPPASENSFSAPFVLSANVLIESVSKDEGFAADGAFRQVSVLVSFDDVPDVIHALANRYFLYLVPEL